MMLISMASVIALASFQSAAANSSRTELRTCLKQAVEAAKSEKVAADGFPAFASARCGTAANSLKAALVSFDLKNNVARARAEADAQEQVDEFVEMAAESYATAAAKP
jgi:hypothetical protein